MSPKALPTTYYEGHTKRDPATGDVAVRTVFPENQGTNLAKMAWLIATPTSGARHAETPEVEGWDDLFVPELVVSPMAAMMRGEPEMFGPVVNGVVEPVAVVEATVEP